MVSCVLINGIVWGGSLTLDERLKLPVDDFLKLPSTFTDIKSRQLYYEKNKKEKWKALSLSYFIPGSGHIYLGHWVFGVALSAFEYYIIYRFIKGESRHVYIYNIHEKPSTIEDDYILIKESSHERNLILAVAMIFIKSIELYDVYNIVDKKNNNLKKKLNIYVNIDHNSNLISGLRYKF